MHSLTPPFPFVNVWSVTLGYLSGGRHHRRIVSARTRTRRKKKVERGLSTTWCVDVPQNPHPIQSTPNNRKSPYSPIPHLNAPLTPQKCPPSPHHPHPHPPSPRRAWAP